METIFILSISKRNKTTQYHNTSKSQTNTYKIQMLNHFSNNFIFQPLKQKASLIIAINLTSTINKIYPIRIRKRPVFWLKTNRNLKSNDEAFFSWWFFTLFLLYFIINHRQKHTLQINTIYRFYTTQRYNRQI